MCVVEGVVEGVAKAEMVERSWTFPTSALVVVGMDAKDVVVEETREDRDDDMDVVEQRGREPGCSYIRQEVCLTQYG